MTESDAAEREFDECESDHFGWDGYHLEDAVRFARMFRRQRDTLRQQLTEAQADRDRLETLYCLIMEHPQPTDVLAQATARMSEELIVAARRFVDAHVAPWIADRNAAIAARLASSSESGTPRLDMENLDV